MKRPFTREEVFEYLTCRYCGDNVVTVMERLLGRRPTNADFDLMNTAINALHAHWFALRHVKLEGRGV